MLIFNDIDLKNISNEEVVDIKKSNDNAIAVIGISAQFGNTRNIDEYWNVLIEGKNCIRDFPENRKNDNQAFLRKYGLLEKKVEKKYLMGSYFDEIVQLMDAARQYEEKGIEVDLFTNVVLSSKVK